MRQPPHLHLVEITAPNVGHPIMPLPAFAGIAVIVSVKRQLEEIWYARTGNELS